MKPRKTLVITGCRELTKGQGKKGPYVLYAIAAKDAEGNVVREELRCFKPLEPTDKPQEFEVERYDGDRGTTFTLTPLAPLTLEELARQVAELRERIGRLESGGSPSSDMPAAGAGGQQPGSVW